MYHYPQQPTGNQEALIANISSMQIFYVLQNELTLPPQLHSSCLTSHRCPAQASEMQIRESLKIASCCEGTKTGNQQDSIDPNETIDRVSKAFVPVCNRGRRWKFRMARRGRRETEEKKPTRKGVKQFCSSLVLTDEANH